MFYLAALPSLADSLPIQRKLMPDDRDFQSFSEKSVDSVGANVNANNQHQHLQRMVRLMLPQWYEEVLKFKYQTGKVIGKSAEEFHGNHENVVAERRKTGQWNKRKKECREELLNKNKLRLIKARRRRKRSSGSDVYVNSVHNLNLRKVRNREKIWENFKYNFSGKSEDRFHNIVLLEKELSENFTSTTTTTTPIQLDKDTVGSRKGNGYILVVSITCGGVVLLITVIVAVRCLKAIQNRASGSSSSLALPIPLLSEEEQSNFNTNLDHSVPMLSVQIANTGMERLGVPTRTSLNSPTDDRGHISRRMRIVNRDITVRDASCGLSDRQTRNNNNNQHQGGCSFLSNSLNCNCKNNYNSDNSNQSTTKLKSSSSTSSTGSSSSNAPSTSSTSSKAAVTRICPHHVTLPDSECRYDRDLQIRAPYQQSEITRSFIKPPPNKCVSDVPKSYQYEQSNYSGISCNLGSNVNHFYQQNNHFMNNQQPIIPIQQQQQQQQQQPKSKPSVITKLFSRKSSSTSAVTSTTINSATSTNNGTVYSPKSPSPSLSSGSASSSSSSLCSAQTLPLAATITSTNCSLGRKQQNSNELITNDPHQLYHHHLTHNTPSLTSTTSTTTTEEQQQQQQQFQQLIVGSTNSNSLSSTSHLLKSSSCNLSSSSMASLLEDNVAASSLSLPYSAPSIDCCYSQATNYPSTSSLARNSNDKENNHRI